jgi:hypothetical protein
MPKKPTKPKAPTGRTQTRKSDISLAPLSMDEAVDAFFAIPKEGVKRVLARPERDAKKQRR